MAIGNARCFDGAMEQSSPSVLNRREFARRIAAGAVVAAAAPAGVVAAAGPAAASEPSTLRGVWKTSHYRRALASPVRVPERETWRYMLTYPFQVAPRKAALSLNIKVSPGPGQDFPVGVDMLVFDDLAKIRAEDAVPFARNVVEPNPNADGKPAIMAAYPPQVGFIPLGALRSDGTPHPHAGTGVAPLLTGARPVDDSEGLDHFPDRVGRGAFRGRRAYQYSEIRQLRFDGAKLTWTDPVRLRGNEIFASNHTLINYGMSAGIPDGDDLLIPLVCRRVGAPKHTSGISRWTRRGGEWQPVSYEPITPEDNSIEPSLVRDIDGSLLFLARGRRESGPPVRLWHRRAGGEWKLVINRQRLTNSTPVTLNSAVDGTPYVLMNLFQPEFRLPPDIHADGGISRLEPKGRRGERSTILLLALNRERDGFETPLLARDPLMDFGIPPRGTIWAADHPTATVVRLADEQWHSIYGYRVLEWIENSHQTPPSPQTGCYLDEAFSLGPAMAPWRFSTA